MFVTCSSTPCRPTQAPPGD